MTTHQTAIFQLHIPQEYLPYHMGSGALINLAWWLYECECIIQDSTLILTLTRGDTP